MRSLRAVADSMAVARSFTVRDRSYRLQDPTEAAGEGWVRVPRIDLRWLIAEWSRSPLDRDELRDALAERYPFEIADRPGLDPIALARTLLDRGWLALWREERPRFSNEAPSAAEPGDSDATITEEQHFLNFTFQYPNGDPAGGFAYRLTDPNGGVTNATLGADGLIDKTGVAAGTYQLELKSVASVAWQDKRAEPGVPAPFVANVIGFDDGAAAKVRFFRECQELDEQVLQEVDAIVEGGRVSGELDYDYTTEERKKEQGVARLVAEVSLEGGKVWGKTAHALIFPLRTLKHVDWNELRIAPGGDAIVTAYVSGYPEGSSADLELWLNDPIAGPTKVGTMNAPIEGDQATKTLRFAPTDDESAAPFEADEIRHTGEYFVKVVIEDEVRRERRSPVLFCDGRPR